MMSKDKYWMTIVLLIVLQLGLILNKPFSTNNLGDIIFMKKLLERY